MAESAPFVRKPEVPASPRDIGVFSVRALTFLVAVAILAVAGFALWERPAPGEAPLSREVTPGITVPADPPPGGGASSPSVPGAPSSGGGGAAAPEGEDDLSPPGAGTPPDDGGGDADAEGGDGDASADASTDGSGQDGAPTALLRDVHDASVVVTEVRSPACVLDLPCEQGAATGNLTFPLPARTVGVMVLAWWNGTSEVPALQFEVRDATGARVAARASYPPLRIAVAAPSAPGPWTVTVAGMNGSDVQLAGDVHLRAVVTRAP